MQTTHWIISSLLTLGVPAAATAGTNVEKIRNDKVIVFEETVAPGEVETSHDRLPSILVFMSKGQTSAMPRHGPAVQEGETVYEPSSAEPLRNTGGEPLHFTRILFVTPGNGETWDATGLSPHYKMLLENQYARAYDIKIPAQTKEPQHTHHDRVVVSLSGAQLEHLLPDGRVQPSTLKTGEIVWRLGGTHVGHNMGQTDLWVIAVEPK